MLRQSLQQKMLQKLSPQQIQLMKMLQLPTIALEQRIKEELEGNPALDEGAEEDEFEDSIDEFLDDEPSEAEQEFDYDEYMSDDEIPDYKLSVSNKGRDDEEREIPFSTGASFQEILETQLALRVISEKDLELGRFLIGNLDESGYLRRELDAIVDDMAFSQNIMTTPEDLLRVLREIQTFDPCGVGARSLQECLLIQLERRTAETVAVDNAIAMVEDHFDAFTKKHFSKITKGLGITESELKDAMDEILKLNPKPGNSLNETQKVIQTIIPDFILTDRDGEMELSLNTRNAPELRVSRRYNEMMEDFSGKKEVTKSDKEAMMFVKQKLDSAKWFIDAIKQRHNTLLNTMEAILNYQYDYFLSGDETKLKPMILKDIAEIVQMDISTVSRVANSKYIQTPYGTFLLKTFFAESLSTDSGEEVSTREVKKILSDSIGEEDKKKPLTDEKLAKLLKDKGYNIARRTVAKYREQLNIPVARLRKEI